ncbi:MAG TPA: NAD-dependent epimerase/dehydratase family protein, partial [Bacteroidales bacterium]
MKILVLGGSGFVGTNVCQLLKNQNYDIKSASLRDGFDFTNFSSTIECFKKYEPDIIINLAAKVGSLNFVTQQAADVIDVNMRMLLNIFKAVEETSDKLVLINPVANCGYPGTINEYSEEKFWDGKVHQSVIAYGNTRRMIEILAECYKMQYGLKIINFFVPNMYGPFDSTDPNKAHALNALVSKIVKANFEKRREFEVWGSGIAVREWLFAKDFGKIIAQTIENLDSFVYKETVNIAQNY